MAFPNQVQTAKKIVKAFDEEGHHVVLLFAQMQSGKTGSFLEAARRLYSTDKFDDLLFICASPATDLNEQLRQSVEDAGLYDDNVFKLHDLRKLDEIQDNTLIVWDEAHFGCREGNLFLEWFRGQGLTSEADFRARGIRLLMVSATPFDLAFVPECVVKMVPPVEYRGVSHYLERVRESNDANLHEVLIREGEETLEPQYGVIRLCKKFNERKLLNEVMLANASLIHKWKVVTYFPTKSGDLRNIQNLVKTMSRRPKSNTLILLKQRCRMGNVLPKKNLKFVYESVNAPCTTSILQSLLGRVCGYHTYTINVYLPLKMITKGATVPKKLREEEEFKDKTELDIYLWAFSQDKLPERKRKTKMYIL